MGSRRWEAEDAKPKMGSRRWEAEEGKPKMATRKWKAEDGKPKRQWEPRGVNEINGSQREATAGNVSVPICRVLDHLQVAASVIITVQGGVSKTMEIENRTCKHTYVHTYIHTRTSTYTPMTPESRPQTASARWEAEDGKSKMRSRRWEAEGGKAKPGS